MRVVSLDKAILGSQIASTSAINENARLAWKQVYFKRYFDVVDFLREITPTVSRKKPDVAANNMCCAHCYCRKRTA